MTYRIGIAKHALGRRTLLKGAGALALAAGLPDLAGAAAPKAAAPTGAVLKNPQDLWSDRETRRLRVKVHAKYGRHDIAGKEVMLRGYDGLKAPRTLRVRAGDTLDLALANDLPPDGAPLYGGASAGHGAHGSHGAHGGGAGPEIPGVSGLNVPHGFNLTNMHVHGLHVSPQSPADNILLTVNPGQTQHYSYAIPRNHPCGLNWYHAHHHGSVALQVASGMGGALIVEGKVDDRREIRRARERVMLLQSLPTDENGRCENYATLERDNTLVYINGDRLPVIEMRPGEVQRWRIVNASHDRFLTLALAGHGFVALGYDGNPLQRTERTDAVFLAPGNRAELLVKASETPGDYVLDGGANYGVAYGPIATVRVGGSPAGAWKVLYEGELVDYAKDFDGHLKPIEDCEIVQGRRVTFGQVGTLPNWTWTIDGQPFAADEKGFTAKLGTAEEWVLINQTNDPHPFHIHINPFQLVEVNGVPANRWLDTVAIPPHGKVRLRTRFLDFDGLFVFHCHTLVHEDQGMMRLVTVVK